MQALWAFDPYVQCKHGSYKWNCAIYKYSSYIFLVARVRLYNIVEGGLLLWPDIATAGQKYITEMAVLPGLHIFIAEGGLLLRPELLWPDCTVTYICYLVNVWSTQSLVGITNQTRCICSTVVWVGVACKCPPHMHYAYASVLLFIASALLYVYMPTILQLNAMFPPHPSKLRNIN